MKIKLIGGPNHGEEVQGSASKFIIPVVYEHASYKGKINCFDPFCKKEKPHEHDNYSANFNRIYNLVSWFVGGKEVTEYHYAGEE